MLKLFTNVLKNGLIDKKQFICPNCGNFVSYYSYKNKEYMSRSPENCPSCFTLLPQVDKIEKDKNSRKMYHENKITV